MSTMSLIRSILVEEFGIADSDVRDTAQLRRDLEFDSTETVGLALALRKEFGVSLRFEAGSDPSLGEICSLVESKASSLAEPR